MTVTELLDFLQKMPSDAIVWMESCDGCYVEAKTVEYQEKENMITIFNAEHDMLMESLA